MCLKNKYNQRNFIPSNAYPQNVNQWYKGVLNYSILLKTKQHKTLSFKVNSNIICNWSFPHIILFSLINLRKKYFKKNESIPSSTGCVCVLSHWLPYQYILGLKWMWKLSFFLLQYFLLKIGNSPKIKGNSRLLAPSLNLKTTWRSDFL